MPNCQYCEDLGEIFATNLKQYVPCPQCELGAQRRADRATRIAKFAAIPSRYANASLSHIDLLPEEKAKGKRVAYKAGTLFVNAPNHFIPAQAFNSTADEAQYNWLVIEGAVGRGKTYLACAILNHLIVRGVPVRYVRLDDIIAEVIGTYNDSNNTDSYQSVISRLQEVKVLLIDEFNAARVTAHTHAVVESVLRYRYNNNMPTLITTNYEQADMFEKWGERITTVVMSNALWIQMTGASLRTYPSPIGDTDV